MPHTFVCFCSQDDVTWVLGLTQYSHFCVRKQMEWRQRGEKTCRRSLRKLP